MMNSLCQSFRSLAFQTFDALGKSRAVGHQPLEETFTDLNILELKTRHAKQIYSQTFNKREEGRNGADWEWWLTNSSRTSWLGLRVQAKVLNLKSNRFEHLHYRSQKTGEYQLDKLERVSFSDGMVPLYCFYINTDQQSTPRWPCGTFQPTVESYGCAIAPTRTIKASRSTGQDDLDSVLRNAIPWHCIFCCHGFGGKDLPERARTLLVNISDSSKDQDEPLEDDTPIPELRSTAPSHVLMTIEGQEPDTLPEGVGGVLVIQGSESE